MATEPLIMQNTIVSTPVPVKQWSADTHPLLTADETRYPPYLYTHIHTYMHAYKSCDACNSHLTGKYMRYVCNFFGTIWYCVSLYLPQCYRICQHQSAGQATIAHPHLQALLNSRLAMITQYSITRCNSNNSNNSSSNNNNNNNNYQNLPP